MLTTSFYNPTMSEQTSTKP